MRSVKSGRNSSIFRHIIIKCLILLIKFDNFWFIEISRIIFIGIRTVRRVKKSLKSNSVLIEENNNRMKIVKKLLFSTLSKGFGIWKILGWVQLHSPVGGHNYPLTKDIVSMVRSTLLERKIAFLEFFG